MPVLTKLGTLTSLPTHVLGVQVVMRPHGITWHGSALPFRVLVAAGRGTHFRKF